MSSQQPASHSMNDYVAVACCSCIVVCATCEAWTELQKRVKSSLPRLEPRGSVRGGGQGFKTELAAEYLQCAKTLANPSSNSSRSSLSWDLSGQGSGQKLILKILTQSKRCEKLNTRSLELLCGACPCGAMRCHSVLTIELSSGASSQFCATLCRHAKRFAFWFHGRKKSSFRVEHLQSFPQIACKPRG